MGEATEDASSHGTSSDLLHVKAEKKTLQKVLRKYELQFEQEHGHAPKETRELKTFRDHGSVSLLAIVCFFFFSFNRGFLSCYYIYFKPYAAKHNLN